MHFFAPKFAYVIFPPYFYIIETNTAEWHAGSVNRAEENTDMLRDTFTLEDGSAEGMRVYVDYEIEREEREDGRVRIPESVYVDKIRVGGWDGCDISGLLHQNDAYEPICEQIEDEMRKDGTIC